MDERQLVPVSPTTRDALLAALRSAYREGGAWFEQIGPAEFFTPSPPNWSPAENVRHLNVSHAPLARALRLPRFVPGLLFGKARSASRSYEQVRQAYREVLAGGAGAGRYAPRPLATPPDAQRAQRELMRQWDDVGTALVDAAQRWDERAMDLYRLPHPLLGKLTVREMLEFALYHVAHHVGNVARRRLGDVLV